MTRKFWLDIGFVLAIEQPGSGVMETDWAENRAEMPPDFLRSTLGKFADLFYTTYKRDKFRTRIERGTEPGTVEIYMSQPRRWSRCRPPRSTTRRRPRSRGRCCRPTRASKPRCWRA